jgi:hypothetical protein
VVGAALITPERRVALLCFQPLQPLVAVLVVAMGTHQVRQTVTVETVGLVVVLAGIIMALVARALVRGIHHLHPHLRVTTAVTLEQQMAEAPIVPVGVGAHLRLVEMVMAVVEVVAQVAQEQHLQYPVRL